VIPLGVDVDLHTPWGERRPLTREGAVTFLFCGGMLPRKGIDVLVDAYLEEFSAAEDVTLIIKAHGMKTHYAGGDYLPSLVQLSQRTDIPAIEVIDEELSPAALAALYRSCDVLVHPYRGEGFGLPVLEAMASALPVIVTAGGATDDFCDESNAWLVDARLVPVDNDEQGPSSGTYCWWEPDRSSLRACLRQAFTDPRERSRRGRAGRERAASRFTWQETARQVAAAVEELQHGVPLRQRPVPSLDTRTANTLLHVPRVPVAGDAFVKAYLTSTERERDLCLVLAVPPEQVADAARDVEALAPPEGFPEVLLVPCESEDVGYLRSVTRWSVQKNDEGRTWSDPDQPPHPGGGRHDVAQVLRRSP